MISHKLSSRTETYDVDIHFVKEGTVISPNSHSSEKFMHLIKVGMARQYIQNLSEEVKKGLKQKAEQGYCTGKPPYGYIKQDKKYSILELESSKFIKRGFELYSKGDISLTAVIKNLFDEGYIYKPNKSKISKAQLEHLLKNPFYYGMIRFNGKLFQGKHEPLITKDLFDKTQLAFKKDNKPKYRNEHDFIFAGMLTCSECGCSITAEIKKEKYIYYHCTGAKKECSQKHQYIKEEVIEKQFIEALKKISISEIHEKWIIEALKDSLKEEEAYSEERLKSLTVQKLQLQERLSKIYIDKLDGIISEEFWLEKHNQWTNQYKSIQTLIQAHENARINYMEEGIKVLKLCKESSDLYIFGNNEERRELLKYVLSNSFLKDGNISCEYKKPFDIFVKGLSCIKWLPRLDSNQQPPG